MTCLTGADPDDLLPPMEPEDEAAAIAAEHQRLAAYVGRNRNG